MFSNTYPYRYILNLILSSDNQDREQVVENIHSYLRKVGEETRKGLIPIEKFIINKVFLARSHLVIEIAFVIDTLVSQTNCESDQSN